MSEPTFNPQASVEVSSIFGMRGQRGLVVLRVSDGEGNRITTMHTAAKAREIAAMLLEEAGSADGDEALMTELQAIGMDLPTIGAFLQAIRKRRALINLRAREEARAAIAYDQRPFDPDAAEPDTPD